MRHRKEKRGTMPHHLYLLIANEGEFVRLRPIRPWPKGMKPPTRQGVVRPKRRANSWNHSNMSYLALLRERHSMSYTMEKGGAEWGGWWARRGG